MSDEGRANYYGYRTAAGGRSPETGKPLPEWDDLPDPVKLLFDGGAYRVLAWMAGDYDEEGNEL
jgi:hypothetical protein